MKNKFPLRTLALLALLVSTFNSQLSTAFAQGTAFTYQGRLGDGANFGTGIYDFYAALGLGSDDKHIATVDADGVALAAIQGLNQKLESGKQKAERRMEKLEAENAELKQRLEKMEQLVTGRTRGAK